MKTNKIFLLGVAVVFTLNLNQPAQAVDLNHTALANSPRIKELFPELRLTASVSTPPQALPDHRGSRLAEVLKNPALAHSPRILEQFPELARSGQTPAESTAAGNAQLAAVLKNSALAHSPRMLEQFPALSRSNEQSPANLNPVGVAPLKQ